MQTATPTKSPVRLFYCDTVECLEALFQHPLFHDKLDLVPCRIYRTAKRLVRLYSEWMTSDGAWDIQQVIQSKTLVKVVHRMCTFPCKSGTSRRWPMYVKLGQADVCNIVKLVPA